MLVKKKYYWESGNEQAMDVSANNIPIHFKNLVFCENTLV